MKNIFAKKVQGAIVLVLVIIMLFSTSCLVFAGETEEFDNTVTEEEWAINHANNPLNIVPSKERINSKGNFTFDFSYALTSDQFKLTSTSTTISCDSYTDPGAPKQYFDLVLYEKIGTGSYKQKATARYDIGYDTNKFSNLSPNNSYYFEMRSPGSFISGNGSITNFKEVI